MEISWTPDTGLPIVGGGDAKASSSSIAKPPCIWKKEAQLQDGLYVPPLDPKQQRKAAKKTLKDTAGTKWFDMPAPDVTPEMKRELHLLKLRSVLDPKRHYKANDSKGIPKYFQVGTVVSGPADFYSGRLTKKERKMTFADELLTDTSLKTYRTRKYTEIQEEKQAGGKNYWKKKSNKRKASWART